MRDDRLIPDWTFDVALLSGAFAFGTVIAELAGAANLGTALAFGQIAFTAALVLILLRR